MTKTEQQRKRQLEVHEDYISTVNCRTKISATFRWHNMFHIRALQEYLHLRSEPTNAHR